MSKRTLVLIIALLVLTIALVVIAVYSPQQLAPKAPTVTPSQPSPTPVKKETMLFLTPDPLQLSSLSGALNVGIETGTNKVSAVQLELSYDPAALGNVDIKPADFFSDAMPLLKNIDVKNGRISYALALSPKQKAKAGTGTVATVTFSVIDMSKGQTTISLLPKTLVTAEGVNPSVLKEAKGATIIFSTAP